MRARLRAKEGFKTVVVKCGLIVGLDMVVRGAVSIVFFDRYCGYSSNSLVLNGDIYQTEFAMNW